MATPTVSTTTAIPAPAGVFYVDNYAVKNDPNAGSQAVAGITNPTAFDVAWSLASAFVTKMGLGAKIIMGCGTYPVSTQLVQPPAVSYGGVISIFGQGRYSTILSWKGGATSMLTVPLSPKPANNWPSFRLESFTFNGNGIATSAAEICWWINGGARDLDCVGLAANSPYNWKFGDPNGNAQELRFEGIYTGNRGSAVGLLSYVSDSTFIDMYPGGQAIGWRQLWGDCVSIHAHPTECGIGIETVGNNVFIGTELDTISKVGFNITAGNPTITGTNPFNMAAGSVLYNFSQSAVPQANISGTLNDPMNPANMNMVTTTSGVWPPNYPSNTMFDIVSNPILTPSGSVLGTGISKGTVLNVNGQLTLA